MLSPECLSLVLPQPPSPQKENWSIIKFGIMLTNKNKILSEWNLNQLINPSRIKDVEV